MADFEAHHEVEPVTSLIWGQKAGRGVTVVSRSPVDGSLLGETPQLNEEELAELLAPRGHSQPMSAKDLHEFTTRLYRELEAQSSQIFQALQRETGFITSDCHEVRDGILHFVRDFCDEGHSAYVQPAARSYEADGMRQVRLVAVPWGTVAVILPSSAALLLAVTCLLNALAAGNRVILRFPASCPLSANILCRALLEADMPGDAVSLVMVSARPLMAAIHRASTPVLVHYLGSSGHAPALISQGFENRKPVITDGEGNTWVWVGAHSNPAEVVEVLTSGALRYNGQTCTSINGALIHPDLYDSVRDGLVARWKTLVAGDPRDAGTMVGTLSSDAHAQSCQEHVANSGGDILCGGHREGALFFPTLVENPDFGSELVTRGLFGPALWIAQGTQQEFVKHWDCNLYPLCAGVLGAEAESTEWAAQLSNVARVVVNGDPSVEWVFEPWGGYATTGNNPVSAWTDKYRRIVALDERARA